MELRRPGLPIAFKQQCSVLYVANGVAVLVSRGDAALTTSDYDRAIKLYSAAIDLTTILAV